MTVAAQHSATRLQVGTDGCRSSRLLRRNRGRNGLRKVAHSATREHALTVANGPGPIGLKVPGRAQRTSLAAQSGTMIGVGQMLVAVRTQGAQPVRPIGAEARAA